MSEKSTQLSPVYDHRPGHLFPHILSPVILELKVNKRLYAGTLKLHDNKNRNHQHHRLQKQGGTSDKRLEPFFSLFRHEMQDITHNHQNEHTFIAHHKLS